MRFLLVLPVLLVVACAGTSSSQPTGSSPLQRVSFRDYRNGTHLSLVNEGSTDRLQYYSEKRANANTKVASDDVMGALVEYLDDQGLVEVANQGSAPVDSTQVNQSIEIERAGRVHHVVAYAGMPADQGRMFKDCVTAVYQTYNAIFQLQAVEPEPGKDLFRGPQPQGR